MKTYNQFIQEALISSLIRGVARQAFKSAAVKKAIPKATTIPVRNYWTNKPVAGLSVAPKAPEKVKLASTITGFRSGGASRGPNFDPMKGSKYQFDPVNQTSISNTAPGHTHTPAGIKPKSTRTYFDTPKNIISAKQNRNYSTLGKDPKKGLTPFEAWKTGDYPAGVEYAHGKFSQPNWSPTHAGSPIVDIQTRTGSQSNLPLFGAERREIRDRVKAALSKPRNIAALKRDLEGARPKIQTESKARQDIESSRYEDDVYRTTKERINDPRLRKLRRFFNREVGRYTV